MRSSEQGGAEADADSQEVCQKSKLTGNSIKKEVSIEVDEVRDGAQVLGGSVHPGRPSRKPGGFQIQRNISVSKMITSSRSKQANGER